jgi:hypothetical protein
MQLVNDTIELHFSISIPLTDVGIGVKAIIDHNGKITYTDH